MRESAWIFGYGSLIWRPGFSYERRAPAVLADFSRRFWQGSIDHRGTPEAPGRVVTLVAEGRCAGVAYEVRAEALDEVLAELDRREQGGYRRRTVRITLSGTSDARDAITYIAAPDNPNYLGPAPLAAIAATIRRSQGPSGSNLEYVSRLVAALRELEADDEHVFELMRLIADERVAALAG